MKNNFTFKYKDEQYKLLADSPFSLKLRQLNKEIKNILSDDQKTLIAFLTYAVSIKEFDKAQESFKNSNGEIITLLKKNFSSNNLIEAFVNKNSLELKALILDVIGQSPQIIESLNNNKSIANQTSKALEEFKKQYSKVINEVIGQELVNSEQELQEELLNNTTSPAMNSISSTNMKEPSTSYNIGYYSNDEDDEYPESSSEEEQSYNLDSDSDNEYELPNLEIIITPPPALNSNVDECDGIDLEQFWGKEIADNIANGIKNNETRIIAINPKEQALVPYKKFNVLDFVKSHLDENKFRIKLPEINNTNIVFRFKEHQLFESLFKAPLSMVYKSFINNNIASKVDPTNTVNNGDDLGKINPINKINDSAKPHIKEKEPEDDTWVVISASSSDQIKDIISKQPVANQNSWVSSIGSYLGFGWSK